MNGFRAGVRAVVTTGLVTSTAVGLAMPAHATGPTCQGETATIVGTSAADDLVGTDGRDVIVGLGGHDVIDGGAGDDLICGGDQSDTLAGGPGEDRLFGGLDGTRRDRGGSHLVPDRLDGGPGSDYLDGGRDARVRTEYVFSLRDEIGYRSDPGAVTIDLTGDTWTVTQASGAVDTVRRYADLQWVGSAYADTLLGSAGSDHVWAGAGGDSIRGGAGNDVLFGEAGYDRIVAGDGNDLAYAGRTGAAYGQEGDDVLEGSHLIGGLGDDQLNGYVSERSGFRFDGGAGRNTAWLQRAVPRGTLAVIDAAEGTVDTIGDGSIFRVQKYLLAWDLRWEFRGSAADERVEYDGRYPFRAGGRRGNDTILGGLGDDYLDGGFGRDVVRGNLGSDTCVNAETTYGCE